MKEKIVLAPQKGPQEMFLVVLCQEKVQVKHELFTSIIRFMPHLFPCVLILSSISFHTH